MIFRALFFVSLFFTQAAMACPEGFAAFQNSVYQKVRRDCALCHDGTNPLAPPFATADAFSSYTQLSNYMNFASIDESLLVIRAGNGHCGKVNCQPPSNIEMSNMANQWWNGGEKICERNGHFFSAPLPLPPSLPDANTGFQTLSIDLGTVKPELAGVTFQIGAQDYVPQSTVTKGSYRFRSPRIVGGNNSIRVRNIKLLLNGKWDVIYNQYSSIDRVVPFFGGATPVLSDEPMQILKDGLPNPKLTVSFVDIAMDNTPAPCVNLPKFSSAVRPQMTNLNCASCHQGTAAATGAKILDFSAGDQQLCEVATALIDPNYVMVSPLILVPSQGVYGHPKLSDNDRYDYVRVIKDWLNK